MSKVGIGVGSWWMLSGLHVIASASGWLAPIAVTALTMGSIVGGSTIFVTSASEGYREYQSLERSLEGKSHDVMVYDAANAED